MVAVVVRPAPPPHSLWMNFSSTAESVVRTVADGDAPAAVTVRLGDPVGVATEVGLGRGAAEAEADTADRPTWASTTPTTMSRTVGSVRDLMSRCGPFKLRGWVRPRTVGRGDRRGGCSTRTPGPHVL